MPRPASAIAVLRSERKLRARNARQFQECRASRRAWTSRRWGLAWRPRVGSEDPLGSSVAITERHEHSSTRVEAGVSRLHGGSSARPCRSAHQAEPPLPQLPSNRTRLGLGKTDAIDPIRTLVRTKDGTASMSCIALPSRALQVEGPARSAYLDLTNRTCVLLVLMVSHDDAIAVL